MLQSRLYLMPTTMEEVLHGETVQGTPADVDIDKLGLAAEIVDRLGAWASAFMDQGPMWEWDSAEDRHRFRLEGFRLAADLQEQLGPEVEVFYIDRLMPLGNWYVRHA